MNSVESFKKWFSTKVFIGRYPTPGEILKSDWNYIINVSDEWIPGCAKFAKVINADYFWFPLSECTSNIGINSIYAAMQILYIAEEENAKVLIHCHAGANRSPLIADCYWYMRTKEHKPAEEISEETKAGLKKMLGCDTIDDTSNLLQSNCREGHLPELSSMEIFLNNMPEMFDKMIASKGGGLDECRLRSNIM